MKAIVNQDTCIGCGLCISTVPEVFEVNADGKAEELLAGMKGDSFALEGMSALLLKTADGTKIKVVAK